MLNHARYCSARLVNQIPVVTDLFRPRPFPRRQSLRLHSIGSGYANPMLLNLEAKSRRVFKIRRELRPWAT